MKKSWLAVKLGAFSGECVGVWKIIEQIDFMHHLEAVLMAVETAAVGAITGLIVRAIWNKIFVKQQDANNEGEK